MAFRLLILGGRQRVEYARLRAALDVLLVNRLPDVELLTAGGPGVPALAACYAKERELVVTSIPLDFAQHRGDAVEWRDARLVEMADAAVLVGDPTPVQELLDRAAAKGIRTVAMGSGQRDMPRGPESPPLEETPRFRGVPD
jgi:hypothetical protein